MLKSRNLISLIERNGVRSACLSRSYSAKPFYYQELFEHAKKLDIPFKKLTSDYVSTVDFQGKKVLTVEPKALTMLSEQAMIDIAHLLRPAHLNVKKSIRLLQHFLSD